MQFVNLLISKKFFQSNFFYKKRTHICVHYTDYIFTLCYCALSIGAPSASCTAVAISIGSSEASVSG